MTTTADFETVTPDDARKWLNNMGYNRNLRQRVVDKYARQMEHEAWKDTGEPIHFGEDGTLQNGQHRLHAIIQCGKSLRMLIVRNVPAGAQTAMDQGPKRTGGDALGYKGYQHTHLLAAAARLAMSEELGLLVNSRSNPGFFGNDEIIEFVANNDDLPRATLFATKSTHRITGLVPAALAYTFWRLRRIDEIAAYEFFSSLFELRTNGEGDPRLALLRRLSSGADRGHRPGVTGSWMVFRTWNSWRKQQNMFKLAVDNKGEPLDWVTPI